MEKSPDHLNDVENHHLGILSQVTGGRFVLFVFFCFSVCFNDLLRMLPCGVLEGTLFTLESVGLFEIFEENYCGNERLLGCTSAI